MKTSTSKSAPMAQATERALEEYFNEVVRLRDIIAKMKGSFQRTCDRLRKRVKKDSRKSKKDKIEMDSILNRILEVYPEAVAIVTAGSNSNTWLSGQTRGIKPVLSKTNAKAEGGKDTDKLGLKLPVDGDILEWTTTDVIAWLATTVELTRYVESFSDEAIDGHLLLTLTNDDLRDDLDVDNKDDREKIMREILKLREQSNSYKMYYGSGNRGDVNKVPTAKTKFTDSVEPKKSRKGGNDSRDIWSPIGETAISPRDEDFDRKIARTTNMEERVHLLKHELSRLRASKREFLSREQQLKMQFEREKDMILREQEEMLNAMQYEQQMMAQEFMQQQQGYGGMPGGMMMMTQQEEDEAWKKEQRRLEIEALKGSLAHVDEKGKALPEALRPKVQKLPSQMNDGVAPPMEHHSPDLKKQPKRSAMKKGSSSKRDKPRVKYAGQKEFNVAVIPRIDDDQIDELFWSQEDQARATEEVDREETMKEFMELKRLREQGIDVPSVNPFRVGANILSTNNNDTWGDMSGIQFAEDDPYFYDDDQNNLTTGNTTSNGLSKTEAFVSLPQQKEIPEEAKEVEDEVEDEEEYGDANFEISGSDEELSEDADF